MRADRGAFLVEMIVAGLLMATAVSLMAGVLVQGSLGGSRLRRKEMATLQAARVLQDLQNYRTADPSPATSASAPNRCWNFLINDACPAGWALSPGRHDLTDQLPPELKDPPNNGRLYYDVSAAGQIVVHLDMEP